MRKLVTMTALVLTPALASAERQTVPATASQPVARDTYGPPAPAPAPSPTRSAAAAKSNGATAGGDATRDDQHRRRRHRGYVGLEGGGVSVR